MAWVDEVPWHRLGQQVPAHATAPEMIHAANLAWNVKTEPAPGARPVPRRRGVYDRNLIVRDPVGREKEGVVLGLVVAVMYRYKTLKRLLSLSPSSPIDGPRFTRLVRWEMAKESGFRRN
jgi:hypothetical protein